MCMIMFTELAVLQIVYEALSVLSPFLITVYWEKTILNLFLDLSVDCWLGINKGLFLNLCVEQ